MPDRATAVKTDGSHERGAAKMTSRVGQDVGLGVERKNESGTMVCFRSFKTALAFASDGPCYREELKSCFVQQFSIAYVRSQVIMFPKGCVEK